MYHINLPGVVLHVSHVPIPGMLMVIATLEANYTYVVEPLPAWVPEGTYTELPLLISTI